MQQEANGQERLIEVTEGNLRDSQLYITPIQDWLPADCVGESKSGGIEVPGVPVVVELEGLPAPAPKDVIFHPARLVPRPYFRAHRPVRQFYRMHGVQAGDLLRATRLDDRRLRVEPTDLRGPGESDQLPPLRLGERATELPAAGIRAAPRVAAPLPRALLNAIRDAHEGKRGARELEWLVGQTLAYLGYPADALQHRLGEPDLPAEGGLLAVVEVRRRLRFVQQSLPPWKQDAVTRQTGGCPGSSPRTPSATSSAGLTPNSLPWTAVSSARSTCSTSPSPTWRP